MLAKPTFKLKCKKCGHFMVKAGRHRQVKKGLRQRHKCQNCGSIQLGKRIDE